METTLPGPSTKKPPLRIEIVQKPIQNFPFQKLINTKGVAKDKKGKEKVSNLIEPFKNVRKFSRDKRS